jgi:NADH-quinone oxidoreductase subunit G
MPTITIDGRACAFEGKKMILQVAIDHGLAIPHYCYHEGLSVVASCRICLAEIEQPNPRNGNQLELIPKLMPTCQTPAADGMVVHTQSPKSIQNQKAVMEYLLINHPLDCPVCDQAGECYLQDYSYQYGRSASRFQEAKIKQPKKDIGPHIYLYADRCIMCSRCVRFTREVTGTREIGVFGRGNREQIDVFPGIALDNELSANVADLCPVGALLDKDFLFAMRVWNLKGHPSIDGLTASGDNLRIDENDGRIHRFKPRTNMDVNQWWISDEIRYSWKHVHSEERLRTPLVKMQGSLSAVHWEAAYAATVQGLKQAAAQKGKGAIALLISPMLPCEEAYLLTKLVGAIDPEAIVGVGPVPRQGQDKTFPGGYTIHAEKAPNARGVRRAAGQLTDEVLDFDAFVAKLGQGNIGAVVLTGNYPSAWITPGLRAACQGKFTVLIDTLLNDLAQDQGVDVLLPGATWTEKAGTFENAKNRLQSFEQAIPVIELAHTEGQIALDLMAAAGVAPAARYDAARLRHEMGDDFASGVHHPSLAAQPEPDLQYVEL